VHIELLKNLHGLYVLTPDGELGVFDSTQAFQAHTEITAALQPHCRQLLTSHVNARGEPPARLGIIYPTRESRPWKSETLLLEQRVVRQLYPVGGVNAPLTAFQKKNQEQSFYRAIESLIGFRATESDAPIFCPVLFDRGRTLDMYLPLLGRAEKAGDAETPVIEVLNLVTDLSFSQRETPALQHIEQHLRRSLRQRERHRGLSFTLLDRVRDQDITDTAPGAYQFDARAERAITLSAEMLKPLHTTQRFDGIECWLEAPARPVQSLDLRRFLHFRDLNEPCLAALAEHNLVYSAPSGTTLLHVDMRDQWNMLLLEGAVALDAADGQSLVVEGGTPSATAPVAFLKPRKYKVTTLGKVSFLWIHDDLLAAVRDVLRAARQAGKQPIKKSGGGRR